jgi:hypothetical protein
VSAAQRSEILSVVMARQVILPSSYRFMGEVVKPALAVVAH